MAQSQGHTTPLKGHRTPYAVLGKAEPGRVAMSSMRPPRGAVLLNSREMEVEMNLLVGLPVAGDVLE